MRLVITEWIKGSTNIKIVKSIDFYDPELDNLLVDNSVNETKK